MILADADFTGWVVAWSAAGAVIVVVAILVLGIILTARRIAGRARDATETLKEARDRTEPLWQVNVTRQATADILGAAVRARRALGGDVDETRLRRGYHAPEADLTGERAQARSAIKHSMEPGPDLTPEEGPP